MTNNDLKVSYLKLEQILTNRCLQLAATTDANRRASLVAELTQLNHFCGNIIAIAKGKVELGWVTDEEKGKLQ